MVFYMVFCGFQGFPIVFDVFLWFPMFSITFCVFLCLVNVFLWFSMFLGFIQVFNVFCSLHGFSMARCPSMVFCVCLLLSMYFHSFHSFCFLWFLIGWVESAGEHLEVRTGLSDASLAR